MSSSTTTPGIPALPIEVAERIIDLVEGTTASYGYAIWDETVLITLQSCALVCRAWLPRCQYHLFRAVNVRCAENGDRTVNDIVNLLEINIPLQRYIRFIAARSGPSEVPKLHLVPYKLPSFLPELEHLRLEGGAMYVPTKMALSAMVKQFTNVNELSFDCLAFYSVQDLWRVVSSLSRLRTLIISSLSWVIPPPSRPLAAQHRRTPIRLQVLAISSSSRWASDTRSVHFVNWLSRSGATDSLQELDLRHLTISEASMFGALSTLLEASKSSLREVDVSLGLGIDFLPCT